MGKKSTGENVRSIERALNILLCFNWECTELTMTEIALKMNLAKSTTSRLIVTLQNLGFLKKDKNNQYTLGYNVYNLGRIAKGNIDLLEISRPTLVEVSKKSQETVILYTVHKGERLCLDNVESPLVIKRTVKNGEIFPLWEGASGRCLLAHLDESLWVKMAKKLKRVTENTISDPDEFFNELRKILRVGYAVSYGESDGEVACISAPILNRDRKLMACLSISGPRFRFPENEENFVKLAKEGALNISKQLGYIE